ncbi:hypothetical protein CLV35_1335 [Motilibacter peucedani]|uniref:Uncharacterized protein n=1 Tax=Motilibacter peucedani TaxID=598650 RepID=A0A420XS53_9ACTN|nr:hypothetical protein [Motilibacter peucedani]RKS77641.1 hypothetical protein CLV35_1335 [Motilibacter peucedani]
MAERPVRGGGREGHAPPGWPAEVRPPGAPDWERTAVGWLLDLCPPDYRAYEVLRRHPAVLARFAAVHVEAAVEGARRGLAHAREDLRDVVPPEALEAAVQAYEREGARLLATGRAVLLVEQALRGGRFVPRL